MKHFSLVVLSVVAVTLVAYWFFPYKTETSGRGIYGTLTIFRWIPYFGMMLMGSWLGLKVKGGELKVNTKFLDVVILFLCIAVFYGIQLIAKNNVNFAPWQIVTLPVLAGIVYYLWRCCNAECFKKLYSSAIGRNVIMLIGGLCLESYLIQFYLFTDKLNWLFPLNLLIVTIYILFMAYVCRCVARLFSQTFKTEDYQWKKVFEI